MRSNADAVLFAVQAFCENHNITEITGLELGLKIGMTHQVMGRILGDLGWRLFRPGNHSPYLRRKGDSHKDFKSTSRRIGEIVLKKLEAHYKIVQVTEEEIRLLYQ